MEPITNFYNEDNNKSIPCIWNDVLSEVMQRKADGQKVGLFNASDAEYEAYHIEARKKLLAKKGRHIRYGLGERYAQVYFTKRESECMVLLLKGKTIDNVAMVLNLSPRTIEFYIKNMKSKVGCRTKSELIGLVCASEFIKNINFPV